MSSGGNFLDDLLLGVKTIQSNGVVQPTEPTINFIGASIVDDPGNKRTNVTVSANPNAVSGTGFWHSTSGLLDGAAKLVNLSTDTTGILPLTDLAQGGATTNDVLTWTGTQWAGSSTIGLSVTMAGDVTGTTAASTVVQLSGSAGTTAVACVNVQWSDLVSLPKLSQKAAQSDVAPQDFTLSAQGPYVSAATHTTAADLSVDVPASVSTGTKNGGFNVSYAGTSQVRMGPYNNGGYAAIWLQDAGSPGATNFAFLSNGASGYTAVNAPAGVLHFAIANVDYMTLQSTMVTLTSPLVQTASTVSQLTVGTNKSAATLVLQADAATTIQTLASTGTELANLSTPAAGTGPRLLGASGRFEVVDSDGTVRIF